jgi:hypothetical protein
MFLPSVHDFERHPAWRWRRCGHLLEHGRRPLRKDDETTREAWRFRRALEGCRDDKDRKQLIREVPDLVEAHSVFTAAEPLRRWELEARLLAGQSDQAIALQMGLSPAGVAAYHSMYFEVRPHLTASLYICCVVIGDQLYRGLSPGDHESLIKLFGYGLGGPGVDAYLDYVGNAPDVTTRLDGLDLPALAKLGARLRTRILVRTLTTPAEDISPVTWRRLTDQFAAARRGAYGAGQTMRLVMQSALDPVTAMWVFPGSPPAVVDWSKEIDTGRPAEARRGKRGRQAS